MSPFGFAWRSLSREPARASLGILGVAIVGALLFDMLLLSQGLLISFRDLLQVLLEGLFVAALGAVVGVVVAASMEDVVNAFFQWRYDTTLVFVRITREIALRCVAIAAPLGTLAGLVASWTLLRRDVADLVRR